MWRSYTGSAVGLEQRARCKSRLFLRLDEPPHDMRQGAMQLGKQRVVAQVMGWFSFKYLV